MLHLMGIFLSFSTSLSSISYGFFFIHFLQINITLQSVFSQFIGFKVLLRTSFYFYVFYSCIYTIFKTLIHSISFFSLFLMSYITCSQTGTRCGHVMYHLIHEVHITSISFRMVLVFWKLAGTGKAG